MVIFYYWILGFFASAVFVLPFVALNLIKSYFRNSAI